ncbi:hypothetical protein BMT54_05115 [Pasteurellaceae bacterium 15-036681]|nr:hypothetical protein BMT54_05115 [Pasteurellaceae bacterium 15-036681]
MTNIEPNYPLSLFNQQDKINIFPLLLGSNEFTNSEMELPFILGVDEDFKPVIGDVTKLPNLIVEGLYCKETFLHSFLLSLVYNNKPNEMKVILATSSKIEPLSEYSDLPHLYMPIKTDLHSVLNMLNWCVDEMERRDLLLSQSGVRNIVQYNEKTSEKLPYIVVIINEYYDFIYSIGREIFEDQIVRLCQNSQTVGIHLILMTNVPSSDIVTDKLKANILSRITFLTATSMDAREILDWRAVKSLYGFGDVLVLLNGCNIAEKFKLPQIDDEAVLNIVKYLHSKDKHSYIEISESISLKDLEDKFDALIPEVCRFMIESGKTSISATQRQFKLGFLQASRIIDNLEQKHFLSKPNECGKREILKTEIM